MASLNSVFCCLWCLVLFASRKCSVTHAHVETRGLSFTFTEPSTSVRQNPSLRGHSDLLYGLKMSSKYAFFLYALQLSLNFAINGKVTELPWFYAKCWK